MWPNDETQFSHLLRDLVLLSLSPNNRSESWDGVATILLIEESLRDGILKVAKEICKDASFFEYRLNGAGLKISGQVHHGLVHGVKIFGDQKGDYKRFVAAAQTFLDAFNRVDTFYGRAKHN